MGCLVRIIAKPQLWSQAEDNWSAGDKAYEVLAELHREEGGISFYEAKGADDPFLAKIAAAYWFSGQNKTKIDGVRFKVIDFAIVQDLRIVAHQTKGRTDDQAVNAAHWDLSPTFDQVIALAEVLVKTPNVEIRPALVAEAVVQGIQQGDLPIAKFSEKPLWALHQANKNTVLINASGNQPTAF